MRYHKHGLGNKCKESARTPETLIKSICTMPQHMQIMLLDNSRLPFAIYNPLAAVL